jgi:thermitase
MRNLLVSIALVLILAPSLVSSTAGHYLEPGQARVNLAVTDPGRMDAVRDLMIDRYAARLVREVRGLSLQTFVVRESDLERIGADRELARMTRYIEEDGLRYVPEFPEILRAFVLGGRGLPDMAPGGASPDGAPNDPKYGQQWGPSCIDAEAAWDEVPDNGGIILAIIDTGVDISHADLRDHYDTSIDKDFAGNDNNANDDMGHGTHVAGIAAAVTNNHTGIAGLAPVTIMGVKVLDFLGIGFDSDIVAGIDYAANNGAHVINMSLGGTSGSNAMRNACDAAFYTHDVVVVAAAGNSSTDRNFYPASFESVIGVSALGTCTTLAGFSNYGTDNVELAAPGETIYSTLPDHLTFWNLFGLFPFNYGYLDGTSMAAPHVAGVAAGYRAYAPGLDAAQVRNAMSVFADDIGDPYFFGNGRVDYYPFQDAGGYGGGEEMERSERDDGVARTGVDRIEAIVDLLKYREVTVEALDANGAVVASTVRRLAHPTENAPLELDGRTDLVFRLRAGEKVSPTFRLD